MVNTISRGMELLLVRLYRQYGMEFIQDCYTHDDAPAFDLLELSDEDADEFYNLLNVFMAINFVLQISDEGHPNSTLVTYFFRFLKDKGFPL